MSKLRFGEKAAHRNCSVSHRDWGVLLWQKSPLDQTGIVSA